MSFVLVKSCDYHYSTFSNIFPYATTTPRHLCNHWRQQPQHGKIFVCIGLHFYKKRYPSLLFSCEYADICYSNYSIEQQCNSAQLMLLSFKLKKLIFSQHHSLSALFTKTMPYFTVSCRQVIHWKTMKRNKKCLTFSCVCINFFAKKYVSVSFLFLSCFI